MAARQKSFASGFTIQSLIPGSDSGPSGTTPRSFGGAPTLFSINRGEKAVAKPESEKRVYPPTYGGGPRQVTTLKSKRAPKTGGGYVPSASDITNSPNPF